MMARIFEGNCSLSARNNNNLSSPGSKTFENSCQFSVTKSGENPSNSVKLIVGGAVIASFVDNLEGVKAGNRLLAQDQPSSRGSMTSLEKSLKVGKFVSLMLGSFVILVNLAPRLLKAAIHHGGLAGYLGVLWGIIVVAVWACHSGMVERSISWVLGE